MGKAFTIQDVVARTGLSVHTLRYYERAGLLPPVNRLASGHRRYTTDELNWIAFLLRLRATGMSIQQMRAYADLRRQGDTTVSARLALLEAHHQQVHEHMRELENHLAAIEQKMHHLRSMEDDEMKRMSTAVRQTSSRPHHKARRILMAKSYYSTIFEQTADQIWLIIRDFGTYTWTGSVSESSIEGGKSGLEVGAIRNARLGNTTIFHRQRLLAHSDLDRFYTYEFCEPFPYPIRNCIVMLRVTPIVDGNKAFVEWSATFDCDTAEYDHWTTYFANEVWSKALGSLKQHFSHSNLAAIRKRDCIIEQ